MAKTIVPPQRTSTIAGDDGGAMHPTLKKQGSGTEKSIHPTGPMHWYVARVRVNYEKKFKILIEKYFQDRNLALETWLPLEKRTRTNSRGGSTLHEAVLLTTFVFVRVEDKNLNEIRFRSDVYKILSEPGESVPYAIPDDTFENFRRIVSAGKAEIQSHPLQQGDKVRIIDGDLAGVVAYVQRIQGKKALIGSEIRNLCGATIEIDTDKLEPIKN